MLRAWRYCGISSRLTVCAFATQELSNILGRSTQRPRPPASAAGMMMMMMVIM